MSEKDRLTEELRQIIQQGKSIVQETDEAEALLSALSLQSTLYPERHVWIDTDLNGITIELEDRTIEDEWDNTVQRQTVQTVSEAAEIAQMWLEGATLQEEQTIMEVLANQPTAEELLALRPSPEFQARISELLAQSKRGNLSLKGERELARYLTLDHLVRLAKAYAYQQLNHR